MKTYLKRLLSGMLSMVLTMSAIPIVSAHAEDSTEPYPYTMFAASDAEGAITVNAGNFCVNGNVATNGTIVSSGNMNVNGARTENAEESMIFIFDKIDYQYFSGSNVNEHEEDYVLDELNINLNVPTEVKGETTLTGNVNINSALKSMEDINLFGEVKNTNDSIIFSKYGDIVIDSQNVNLNGLVYAPFGTVDITAQNLNLNNVVIIAESIVLNCPSVNANNSTNMSTFVGNASEGLDIPADELCYWEDSNNNGLPDYFEDMRNWGLLRDDDSNGYPNIIESFLGAVDNDCDTDGDRLPDWYETLVTVGTDPLNPDSDGDSVSDYYEHFVLNTDPLNYDSDQNGINDGAEDFDNDYLLNSDEELNETDPFKADTDGDTLTDYQEINEYSTNPRKYDTDDDGINDGAEILNSLNPNNPDTNGNGILDGQELIENQVVAVDPSTYINFDEAMVLPKLEITGVGDYSSMIYYTDKSYESTFSNIPYICGHIISINHPDYMQYESARLTFTINPSILALHPIDDLMIFRFDSETGEAIGYDTSVVDSETICADVDQLCSYGVGIKSAYFDLLGTEEESEDAEISSYGNVDIIFAIDTTGSMGNTVNNVINNIQSFFTSFESDSLNIRVGLISFKDLDVEGPFSTTSYGWFENPDELITQLQKLSITGGDDPPESALDALMKATEMKTRIGAEKHIVLITDETYKKNYSIQYVPFNAHFPQAPTPKILEYELPISFYANNLKYLGYHVSVITNTNYYSNYRIFTDSTDGYLGNINGSFSNELSNIISEVKSDVEEGRWIRLADNRVVKITDGDQDGDGIPDYAELGPTRSKTINGQAVEYYTLRSDFTKRDTDGDGVDDNVDVSPMCYDICVSESISDYKIKLNTGKTFNVIFNEHQTYYTYTHLKNMKEMYIVGGFDAFLNNADSTFHLGNSFFSTASIDRITELVDENNSTTFTPKEAAVLSLFDIESAKLTMLKCDETSRRLFFEEYLNITGVIDSDDSTQILNNYAYINDNINSFFWVKGESFQHYVDNYLNNAVMYAVLGPWGTTEVNSIGLIGNICMGFLPQFAVIQSLEFISYDIATGQSLETTLMDMAGGALDVVAVYQAAKVAHGAIIIAENSDNFTRVFRVASEPSEFAEQVAKLDIVNTANVGLNHYSDEIYTCLMSNLDELPESFTTSAFTYKIAPYDNEFIDCMFEFNDDLGEIYKVSPNIADDTVERTLRDSISGDTLKSADEIKNAAGLQISKTNSQLSKVQKAVNSISIDSSKFYVATIDIADGAFDDSIKAITEKLRQMVVDGTITGTNGEALSLKRNQKNLCVMADKSTGRVYYGISSNNPNNPTILSTVNDWLVQRMKHVPQTKNYPLDNCAEFKAINAALQDGADLNNLVSYTVWTENGNFHAPCRQCQAMYQDFISSFLDWE